MAAEWKRTGPYVAELACCWREIHPAFTFGRMTRLRQEDRDESLTRLSPRFEVCWGVFEGLEEAYNLS